MPLRKQILAATVWQIMPRGFIIAAHKFRL
jgi:hypothetical protein